MYAVIAMDSRALDLRTHSYGFRWVPTNEAISTRQGRGGLSPTSTWDGHALLNLDEVDELISKIDTLNDRSQDCNESACSCFSVFDAHVISSNGFPHDTYGRLPRSLDAVEVDWEFGSRYLYHHYVNYVAPQMMPLKNDCNPWTTLYPSMACTSEGVRSALLSQAVAHLYHLRCKPSDMVMWVLRHRATALHCLRAMISNQDPGSFKVTVATILSLIMAGVYYGGTQEWRCHLFGALEIASHRMVERPWIKSEMAWLAAQSLYLLLLRIKVDHGVDQPGRDATLKTCLESEFLRSLSCRPDFGFTLGVSRDLALCLTESVRLIDA